MEESLATPTATSFRTIEVGTLEARRSQLNQALAGRQPEVKLSYTHMIAFALTWAAREMPVFSTSFARAEIPDALDRSYQSQLDALQGLRRAVAEISRLRSAWSYGPRSSG